MSAVNVHPSSLPQEGPSLRNQTAGTQKLSAPVRDTVVCAISFPTEGFSAFTHRKSFQQFGRRAFVVLFLSLRDGSAAQLLFVQPTVELGSLARGLVWIDVDVYESGLVAQFDGFLRIKTGIGGI